MRSQQPPAAIRRPLQHHTQGSLPVLSPSSSSSSTFILPEAFFLWFLLLPVAPVGTSRRPLPLPTSSSSSPSSSSSSYSLFFSSFSRTPSATSRQPAPLPPPFVAVPLHSAAGRHRPRFVFRWLRPPSTAHNFLPPQASLSVRLLPAHHSARASTALAGPAGHWLPQQHTKRPAACRTIPHRS